MLAADAPEFALGIERLVNDVECRRPEPDPFLGMRLGPWRVVDALGRGGMGKVYLAERADGQYDAAGRAQAGSRIYPSTAPHRHDSKPRRTSLRGCRTRNIARLLDAGHTPEGSAYLVMEYVDGTPITSHCDARRLTVDERLRLFRLSATPRSTPTSRSSSTAT